MPCSPPPNHPLPTGDNVRERPAIGTLMPTMVGDVVGDDTRGAETGEAAVEAIVTEANVTGETGTRTDNKGKSIKMISPSSKRDGRTKIQAEPLTQPLDVVDQLTEFLAQEPRVRN